jgi:hypothetical protein
MLATTRESLMGTVPPPDLNAHAATKPTLPIRSR